MGCRKSNNLIQFYKNKRLDNIVRPFVFKPNTLSKKAIMKKIFLLLFISSSILQAQHVLTERLQEELNSINRLDQKVSIRIQMLDKVDAFEMHKEFVRLETPIQERARQTVLSLQQKSKETQFELLEVIRIANPEVFNKLRNYWVINNIYAEAPINLIYELGKRDDIAFIDLNADISSPLEIMESEPMNFEAADAMEPGLIAINAPALWHLGYTGKGLLVYDYDTGVCAEHPAIKERFLANRFPMDQSWYGYFRDFPNEINSDHGTHTLGTILGEGLPSGDTIGVAPGAYWIACDLVTTTVAALPPLENIVAAYEWALDSDENPETTFDIPAVINNSWRWRDEADTVHCNDYIVDLMNALEAAGIASVFSGGNSGPSNTSVNAPQRINTTIVNTFSVGSINANDDEFAISTFSTRGPLQCPATDSSLIIHPEVVAPGQSVRSSTGMNSYDTKSGTSMAAPHVSGAVLLLKEAFPNLSGADLLTALYFTAIDMGDLGEDNTFGMGLIDCLAAFEYLSLTNTPTNPFETLYDVEVLEILEPQSELFCSATVNPSFVIINNGDSTLHTIQVLVNLNGEELTSYTWEGTLISGGTITETIEGFTIDEDVTQKHELQVQVSLSNIYEKDVFNNSLIQRFSYHGFTNAPFIETFESNTLETNNWKIENIDADRTWEIEEAEGIEGSTLSAKMRMYNYSSIGQRDALVSPNINLEEGADYNLYFSYAHQNRNIGSYDDSLIVQISTDCGVNFQRVFAKGGDQLETTDTLDLNFEPSYPTHWRNETIDISQYVPNANTLIVKFTSVNGKQNNLYLDNVFVSTPDEFSITNNLENQFSLFPNPASKTITLLLNTSNNETKTFDLIDLSGRVLESKTVLNEQTINWDLSFLEAGYYIINMKSSDGNSSHSFIKK